MRKLLVLLMIASTAFIFNSCKGDDGRDGYDGYDGRDGKDGKDGEKGKDGANTNWVVFDDLLVKSDDWKIGGGDKGQLNTYYYADIKIEELTETVFLDGNVLAYRLTGKNTKNGMPSTVYYGAEVSTTVEELWSVTYDYEFSPGWVRFYVSYSNFSTSVKPNDESFSLVLMW